MDSNRIAFRDALLNGEYDTVNEMLENGFDVNMILVENGRIKENGIYICAKNGLHKIAELLLKHGCKLSIPCGDYEDTPLHKAVVRRDFDMVKLLLDNGADVTCKDKGERTALHLACERDRLENVKLLVERNRTLIHMLDVIGDTPFYGACRCGTPELIQYLVEEGADVQLTGRSGSIPFQILLSWNHRCTPNIVRFLVDNGADLSARNLGGDTPLHVLIEKNYREEEYRDVLLYVMERSDLSARNYKDENILMYILLYGDLDLLKKFLNIGMPEDALSGKFFHSIRDWRWKDMDPNRVINFNMDAIDLLLDIGVPSSSLLHFYPDSEDIRLLQQEFQRNPDKAPEWDLNDLSVLREHVVQRCG